MHREIKRIIITATESKVPDDLKDITQLDKKFGLFEIGCHYLITTDGVIHKGRDESKQGNYKPSLDHNSIIIRVVGLGWDFTEAQTLALFNLEDSLLDKYKEAEVHDYLPVAPKVKKNKNK